MQGSKRSEAGCTDEAFPKNDDELLALKTIVSFALLLHCPSKEFLYDPAHLVENGPVFVKFGGSKGRSS